MSLLGIELSDAGILMAGTEPPGLLPVDGDSLESPGYALSHKKELLLGRAAARQAHLYPRKILNRFWDRLDTEPLAQPLAMARNHAEVAFEHLTRIWSTAGSSGREVVIAVPGFYGRQHLGLLLGITREAGIAVKGFVPLAVAAAPDRLPAGPLLHVDVHLHRLEVTRLAQSDHLSRMESVSAEGSGLIKLYRLWGDAIAGEFVRTTRFDPLHRAATEQILYDRLPGVLAQLNQADNIFFEMNGGSRTYPVTVTRDLLTRKAAPVFAELRRMIQHLRAKEDRPEAGPVFLLSHRAAVLPGIADGLAVFEPHAVIELEPGAGALGVQRFDRDLFDRQSGQGAPFITSRPPAANTPATLRAADQLPTHILHHDYAYPITAHPLVIGTQDTADIVLRGNLAGVAQQHCTVQLRGGRVLLTGHSDHKTFVDESPVTGPTLLRLGQTVRVGAPGTTFKLIACLNRKQDAQAGSNDR